MVTWRGNRSKAEMSAELLLRVDLQNPLEPDITTNTTTTSSDTSRRHSDRSDDSTIPDLIANGQCPPVPVSSVQPPPPLQPYSDQQLPLLDSVQSSLMQMAPNIATITTGNSDWSEVDPLVTLALTEKPMSTYLAGKSRPSNDLKLYDNRLRVTSGGGIRPLRYLPSNPSPLVPTTAISNYYRPRGPQHLEIDENQPTRNRRNVSPRFSPIIIDTSPSTPTEEQSVVVVPHPEQRIICNPRPRLTRGRSYTDARIRRYQFTINNFLERPRGALAILYHLSLWVPAHKFCVNKIVYQELTNVASNPIQMIALHWYT